jgi:hypothetical protein
MTYRRPAIKFFPLNAMKHSISAGSWSSLCECLNEDGDADIDLIEMYEDGTEDGCIETIWMDGEIIGSVQQPIICPVEKLIAA